MIRKIFIGLLLTLVVIQFIRPAKNQSSTLSANDISHVYAVPPAINEIFKKSCNDCHSNNTVYPWYSNLQPVAWWLENHVNDGKRHFNFSEFASYTPKKQHHKLEEFIEMVKEEEMPLNSYTWIHKEAILTTEEKLAISSWADNLRKEIASKYNIIPEKK